MKSPLMRGTLALGRDFRSAIVGVVVAGGLITWRVVLHDHVRVRAWVLVVLAVLILIAVITLDFMRARERNQRLISEGKRERTEGDLTTTRRELADATAERQPNPAAQEVLAQIGALKATILRRVGNYTATTGLDARQDEIARYHFIVGRVQAIVNPMPRDLADMLGNLLPERGCPPAEALVSGLDHMEVEVRNWGLQYGGDAPAPEGGGPVMIVEPGVPGQREPAG